MGPNKILFFPVKLEINLDLMVEISTGNTSESSTGLPSKSAILAILRRSFQILTPKSVAGRNFYGSQNFENRKVWCFSFIVHFESIP